MVPVGASAADTDGWVARNFTEDQTLSLERCRRLVAGAGVDRGAVIEGYNLLLRALDGRARRALTTAVCGDFVEPDVRRRLLEVTRHRGRPAVAVVFRLPETAARFRSRDHDLVTPSRTLRRQLRRVEDFLAAGRAEGEGWSRVVVLDAEAPDLLPAVRYTLPASLPHPGPFDVVGDVHGCLGELDRLLDRLGWAPPDAEGTRRHPEGRVAVFVGDYADRGPDSPGVFRRVMAMHAAGTALAVPGNHCVKLVKWMRGRPVQTGNGLERTIEQLRGAGEAFRERVRAWLERLPPVLVLAGGRLVVFHAALPREAVGRLDETTRVQTTYGVVRGFEEGGRPIRDPGWTESWKPGEDEPFAVYGHTPVREPERRANTLDIDGGCVFGGYLAALRFPERTLVCEPAAQVWFPSPRVTWRGAPPGPTGRDAPHGPPGQPDE